MNFNIYTIGNNKISKYLKEAIKEYEKRLSRYCKIKLINVNNKNTLKRKISDKTYIISISNIGNKITSEELAKKINNYAITRNSDISIILDNSSNINYNEILSISYLEMDPDMKATIIYEQIYRAYRILNNEPYHK